MAPRLLQELFFCKESLGGEIHRKAFDFGNLDGDETDHSDDALENRESRLKNLLWLILLEILPLFTVEMFGSFRNFRKNYRIQIH